MFFLCLKFIKMQTTEPWGIMTHDSHANTCGHLQATGWDTSDHHFLYHCIKCLGWFVHYPACLCGCMMENKNIIDFSFSYGGRDSFSALPAKIWSPWNLIIQNLLLNKCNPGIKYLYLWKVQILRILQWCAKVVPSEHSYINIRWNLSFYNLSQGIKLELCWCHDFFTIIVIWDYAN